MDPAPPATPSTTSRFRAPDGGVVTVTAPGYDLSGPWDADVQIRVVRPYAGVPEGRQLRELHVARVGNYTLVVEEVLGGHWVNTVEAQGGHFMIAHSEGQQGLAIWRGQWHEAATWLPDPTMDDGQALHYFDQLLFNDHPDGLQISSSTPEVEVVETRRVSKHVPGVGPIDIRPAEIMRNIVPSWSGAQVRTGEVWREVLSDDDEVIHIHATESTVTMLQGEGGRKPEEGPRLDFLEKLLELTWT